MAFADLRETLAAFRERGWVLDVDRPLSARYEVAAFLALVTREGPRACVFTHVVPDATPVGPIGDPAAPAMPVVANMVHSRDVLALAMGVGFDELVDTYGARMRAPVDPLLVDDAPVLEVGLGDGEFDLTTLLPMLTHYEGDAGPFITAGMAAMVDPFTGATHRTICRMQLLGRDRLGLGFANPPLGQLWQTWVEAGESVRVAVVVGLEPVTLLAGALPPVAGVDKLRSGGGLRAEPIDVVAGPYSGVHVPARAELLIEGDLEGPGVVNGPLGEISGYYLTFSPTPTLRVRRISHRTSPLYQALLPTGPEGDYLTGLVVEAQLAPHLRGLYSFARELAFAPGTFGSSLVVSVAKTDRTRARGLLYHLLSLERVKKVVLVAEDVDPNDARLVEWSIVTRSQPDVDVLVVSDVLGHPIDPSATSGKRTSRVGIDATGFGYPDTELRVTHPAGALARAREVLGRPAILGRD